MSKRFYAKIPFEYAGKQLDRGQITELSGQMNDERLLRIGYLVETAETGTQCGTCGGHFLNHNYLRAHGDLRHSGLEGDDLADAIEREQRRAQVQDPLRWDQTEASRKAGEHVLQVQGSIVGGDSLPELDLVTDLGEIGSEEQPETGPMVLGDVRADAAGEPEMPTLPVTPQKPKPAVKKSRKAAPAAK